MRNLDPDLLRRMEAYGRETARALETVMKRFGMQSGEKWGFALFVFSFDGPEFTWISNAERKEMLDALRDFIRKAESGEANMSSQEKN